MFLLLRPILIVSSLVWWRTASCLIALQVQFLRLWRSARSPFKQVELLHNQNIIKIYQNKLLRFSVLGGLRAPLSLKCMLGSVGPWGIHANMQFYRKAFDTKNAHTLTDTPARDTIHHLIAHDHTRTVEPSSHTSFQHKSICPLVWKQETLVSSLEGIAWKYELLFQILIFILQVWLQLPSRLFKNLLVDMQETRQHRWRLDLALQTPRTCLGWSNSYHHSQPAHCDLLRTAIRLRKPSTSIKNYAQRHDVLMLTEYEQ